MKPPTSSSCIEARCTGGTLTLVYSAATLDCTSNYGPMGKCGVVGDCNQCNLPQDCTNSGVCFGHTCYAPSCADKTQNGYETDMDCGGPVCPPCVNGNSCLAGTDCQSGNCVSNQCQ